MVRALLLTASLLSVGCEVGPRTLRLQQLPLPQGGTLYALANVKDGEKNLLVAPTHKGMFVFDPDERQWHQADPAPLTPHDRATSDYNLNPERFVTHENQIWWLDGTSMEETPKLLMSQNAGASWKEVPLPGPYQERFRPGNPKAFRFGRGSISAQADLRLVAREGSLYLLDANAIWKLEGSAEAHKWVRLSLEGISLKSGLTRDHFPAMLRHYIPATPQRPYEIMTVLGEQLMIYARARGTQSFALMNTLATVDRAIEVDATGSHIFLLSPDAIYFADENMETWDKVRLIKQEIFGEECEHLLYLPDAEDRTRGSLLVGTSAGKLLWGHLNDRTTWKIVQESDPDQRGITDMLAFDDGKLFASTRGSGVLVSEDGGLSWATRNEGLLASRPYDFSPRDDTLLLGTDAGLYTTTISDFDTSKWEAIHDRSTTSLRRREDEIWSGTAGGQIVIWSARDGVKNRSSLSRRKAPLYLPHDKQGLTFPEQALLTMLHREQTQFHAALSHGDGLLVSQDSGKTWLQEGINETLERTLDGSHISESVIAPGATRYIISEPIKMGERAQLWRTDDDGLSWRSVYTFPQEESHNHHDLRHAGSTSEDDLLLIASDRLRRSQDGGQSWETLQGPWEGKTILAFKMSGERAVMLLEDQAHLEVLDFTNLNEPLQEPRRYKLRTQQGAILDKILAIEITPRGIFLRAQTSVWVASSNERTTELTYNLTVLLAAVITLLLGAVAFMFMRRFDGS